MREIKFRAYHKKGNMKPETKIKALTAITKSNSKIFRNPLFWVDLLLIGLIFYGLFIW